MPTTPASNRGWQPSRSYLDIGDESPARWAARYVEAPDAYLRESAILALKRDNTVIDDPAAHALLSRVLTSKRCPGTDAGSSSSTSWGAGGPGQTGPPEPLANLALREDLGPRLRHDALQTLGFTDQGPDLLANLAARHDYSMTFRRDAIEALGATDQGQRLIEEMISRDDPRTDSIAVEAMASPGAHETIPDQADRENLSSLLRAPSRSEQRQAVERIANHTLTPGAGIAPPRCPPGRSDRCNDAALTAQERRPAQR